MNQVEVQVLEPEVCQRSFQRGGDMLLGVASVPELGRDEQVVAGQAGVLQADAYALADLRPRFRGELCSWASLSLAER